MSLTSHSIDISTEIDLVDIVENLSSDDRKKLFSQSVAELDRSDQEEILKEIPVELMVDFVRGSISINVCEKDVALSYYRNELDLKKLIREIGKENVEAALKGL